MNVSDWYSLDNVAEVESPSLLIYPDRVDENIRRMVQVVGDPARLRPHVKTHKLGPLSAKQIASGIKKFKAATIPEAEMLGNEGAEDILLAYQPVGPNADRFLQLAHAFPRTRFSCLIDDFGAAKHLSELAVHRGARASVFLDVDCGMHRTGIPADENGFNLYREMSRMPGLQPRGLHAYDGHLHEENLEKRVRECDAAFEPVNRMASRLREYSLPIDTIVAGGTPTFPIHAKRAGVECSPGTTVLWDYSYSSQFLDLDFLHAAVVLSRVISKPGGKRLCLDLGHKSIAAEKPHPRVVFLNCPDARAMSHSEEHLVIETDEVDKFKVGDCFYGIPRHVCPTVALYGQAVIVENRRAAGSWRIEARERHLKF